MRAGGACIAAIAAGTLIVAASASAHGVIERDLDVLAYRANDPGVGATLTIRSTRPGTVTFSDPFSPGTMSWGPCFPLSERRARCRVTAVSRILVEVYDEGDSVTAPVSKPLEILAADGNDAIDAGYGNDAVYGGTGNDSITGGKGRDGLDGGAGDDTIDARDGFVDSITCGDGADSVSADPADVFAAEGLLGGCEQVDRADPPPDLEDPRLKARGRARQPLERRRLRVTASSSEPGEFTAKGQILIDGSQAGRLSTARGTPDAPGQWWKLRPRATPELAARIARALGTGSDVIAAIRVRARDDAGNSSPAQRIRVKVVAAP